MIRDLATQIGATFDLDDGTGYGIVTHDWITKNWWGDHTDPYGYLAQWGINKAQLAQDLQTGLPEDGSEVIVNPGKPNKPKYKVGQHVRFTTTKKSRCANFTAYQRKYTVDASRNHYTKLNGRKIYIASKTAVNY